MHFGSIVISFRQDSDRAAVDAKEPVAHASPIQIGDSTRSVATEAASSSSSPLAGQSSVGSAQLSSVGRSPMASLPDSAAATSPVTPASSSLSDARPVEATLAPPFPPAEPAAPVSAPDAGPLVVHKKGSKGRKVVKKMALIAPATPDAPRAESKLDSATEVPQQPKFADLSIPSHPTPLVVSNGPSELPVVDSIAQLTPTVVELPPADVAAPATSQSEQLSRSEYFSTRQEVEAALNTEFEPKSHFLLLQRLLRATASLISDHGKDSAKGLGIEEAAAFFDALEAILADGLRPATKIWTFLSRSFLTEPTCRSPAPSLSTATGRARSVIFTFLNEGRLRRQLETALSASNLLSDFYWPTALVANDQRVAMLLALLRDFDDPHRVVTFELPTSTHNLDSLTLFASHIASEITPGSASLSASPQRTTSPPPPIGSSLAPSLSSSSLALTNILLVDETPVDDSEGDLAAVINLVDGVLQTDARPVVSVEPRADAPAPPPRAASPPAVVSDTTAKRFSVSPPASLKPFDAPAQTNNPFDEPAKSPPSKSYSSSNLAGNPETTPFGSEPSKNPFDAPRPVEPAKTEADRPPSVSRVRGSSTGESDSKPSRTATISEGVRPVSMKVRAGTSDWAQELPRQQPSAAGFTAPASTAPPRKPIERVTSDPFLAQSPPRDLKSGARIIPGAAPPPDPHDTPGSEARSVTFNSFEELFKSMRESGAPGAPLESQLPKGSKPKLSGSAARQDMVAPSGSSSQRYATTAFSARGGGGNLLSASVPISSKRRQDDPFAGSPPESLLNVKVVWEYTPATPYKKLSRANRFLLLSAAPMSPERGNPDRLRTFAGFGASSAAFGPSSSSAEASEMISVKEPEVVVEAQQATIQGQDPRATFVLDLVPKKKFGIKTANCAECGEELEKKGVLGKEPAYCYYTSNYYCADCHKGRISAIPARIVNNWDFKEYPVSNWAKRYIDENFKNPILDVDRIGAGVQKKIPALSRVRAMRERLVLMGEYIQSCRNSSRLLTEVEGRTHLVWSSKQCSLEDLDWLRDGRLEKFISHVVDVYIVHITTCEICKGKGFFCEICNAKQLLFLFQEGVIQCPKCKNVFHSRCFERVVSCPKCDRVKRIRSRSNPSVSAAISSESSSSSRPQEP